MAEDPLQGLSERTRQFFAYIVDHPGCRAIDACHAVHPTYTSSNDSTLISRGLIHRHETLDGHVFYFPGPMDA